MREDTGNRPGFDDLTVSAIMMRDVVSVTPDMSVADLIRLLEFEQISGVPVIENESVAGVVSVTDILRLAAYGAEVASGDTGTEPDLPDDDSIDERVRARTSLAYFIDVDHAGLFGATEGNAAFSDSTVREIMTPATFSVQPDTSVVELARFLTRGRIHRSLVLDGDRLAGIVTTSDVVRAIAEHAPEPVGA